MPVLFKDLDPNIERIETLVNNVKIGDIKLPKFQRPFVWNKSDILKLWDSIYRGYPIGSILLWLTKEKLASERKIGELDINDRPDEYPTNYLLDGQQRLSSLCGPLYYNGDDFNSLWKIYFNCDTESFEYIKEADQEKMFYFPLNKLLDTRDYINQCTKFSSSPNKDKYISNADKLLRAVKDYKIASIRIGEMNLDEVAPIFERINSSGRQLTIVDLMRAATWKGDFDLNDAIISVRDACESKNFEDIKDTHILRSISGCAGNGIHKEDLEKLRDCSSDELKTASKRCINAYKLAVDFITTELPLPSISYLPYGLQLTYLVDFFDKCPTPSAHQRHKLIEWFWKTSFTLHYGTANTGLITKDLVSIREFALNTIEKPLVDKKINFRGFIQDNFILNKASSMSFALLLAMKEPKSFLDGSKVDVRRALAVTNKLEYHHIFPKAYLKELGFLKSNIDCHSNICMQNLFNNREISNKKPSEYFPIMQEKLGDKLISVLDSHYINEGAFQACLSDDFELFKQLREDELKNKITSLVDDEVL